MNIIVIGAGYGGITAVLRLERLFRHTEGTSIHLVDRNPYHTLKTQLHEAAVRKKEVAIPIARIIKNRHIQFHQGLVVDIDITGRRIVLEGATLPFDFLLFALGSQANFYNIPGLKDHSFPLQTLSDAQKIYDHLNTLCRTATDEETNPLIQQEMLRFVIGGGGLSGVEFAAELADHASRRLAGHASGLNLAFEIIIIEATERILPGMNPAMIDRIEKNLAQKDIQVITRAKITGLTPETVSLSSGEQLRTRTLIWTGGIVANRLVADSGLKTGQMGRIVVDEFLRAAGRSGVYAIGDNALASNPGTGKPVPTAAQFALQQGRLAAENIHAAATGGRLRPYRPQVLGEIISLGRHLAVGWMALPLLEKITFFGFVGRLLKTATEEKHLLLLHKESQNWGRW